MNLAFIFDVRFTRALTGIFPITSRHHMNKYLMELCCRMGTGLTMCVKKNMASFV